MNSKGNLIIINPIGRGKLFFKNYNHYNKLFKDWYNSIKEKSGKKYIYLHLTRCAGYATIKFLKNSNLIVFCTGHQGIDNKPIGFVTVGSIRNPFSWYVSLWRNTFQRGIKYGKSLKNRLYTHLLKKHEYNYYYNDEILIDKKGFKNFLLYMINDYTKFRPYNESSNIRKKYNIGYMTQVFFRMYNNNNYKLLENISENPIIDFFIKKENLINDINKYFNVNISYLENTNKNNHAHYSKYYDEELKKLIYEKDRYIFKFFKYT